MHVLVNRQATTVKKKLNLYVGSRDDQRIGMS